MTTPPRPVEYLALVVNVLLVAAVLTGLSVLARRVTARQAVPLRGDGGGAGDLCIPLNAVRAVLSNRYPAVEIPADRTAGHARRDDPRCLPCHRRSDCHRVLPPPYGRAPSSRRWRCSARSAPSPSARRPGRRRTTMPPPIATGRPLRESQARGKSPRVLWVIADEWDYRLTFVDRNPTLQLPEIDRLRGTSLYADHASPPGLGNADFDSGILLRQTRGTRPARWAARIAGGVSRRQARRGAVERAIQCFRAGPHTGRQHRSVGVVSPHVPRAQQPDLLQMVAHGDAAQQHGRHLLADPAESDAQPVREQLYFRCSAARSPPTSKPASIRR